MQQHDLRPPKGATHKRKRVGRGNASGHGTYATKGMKGQKARSGGGVRPHFEGGQLPFVRRMAYKRGFRNPFRIEYEEVNVGELARFDAGSTVNADALKAERIVQRNRPLKILGGGEIAVALTVEADRFSKQAKAKIEAAGGSVRWINGEPEPKQAPEPKAPKKAAAKTARTDAEAPEGKPARQTKKQPAPRAEASEATAQPAAGAAPEEEADDGTGS
jgi:large subunit ribosomal protein L15